MEEIKVENNDVVDTTKPAEETTPATPVEEVKTEDTIEATEEKKDNWMRLLQRWLRKNNLYFTDLKWQYSIISYTAIYFM